MNLIYDQDFLIRITGLAYSAVIGSVIGSFYTAAASRVLYFYYGRGRKDKKNRMLRFFTEPSRCDHCRTPLKILQLIPVISFLIQRGRCSACGSPIGWPVFAGELFLTVLFPLLLILEVHFFDALILVIFSGHLFISIAVDYRYYQLDWENALWLAFWIFIFSLRYAVNDSFYLLFPNFLSSFLTGLIFLFLWVFTKGKKLGGGDVIFAPLPAFFIPVPYTPVYLAASSVLALLWAFTSSRKGEVPIPFGVFLSLGFYVSVVFAESYSFFSSSYF